MRFYHQLYREQAGRYDRLTGEGVTVGGRRAGPAGSVVSTIWSVDNEQAGVETDYEFLRWEDLVGKVWIRNPLTLAFRSIATYVGHGRFMQFKRMKALRPGPVLTICISAVASGKWLNKLVVPWLLRFTYYHHTLAAGGPGDALDARLDAFARRMAEELDEPWDEVLFLTHSAGTI
nr:hypothetical protein [Sphingobium sp.]